MKQVFLHIGTHKTGTTSLQNILHENRQYLAELGYLYPSTKKSHANLAFTLMNRSQANYELDTWEDIIHEIENNNLEKIILSSECFIESNKIEYIQQVAEKLKKYKTKIIIYLKRQDKKIESLLNHRIKLGSYTGNVDFYLANKKASGYLKILNKWSNVFGRENIIVRPLEKEQVPDLYQDFLENVGIASLDGFKLTKNFNTKPNLPQIIALNFSNQKIAAKLGLEEGFHQLYDLNHKKKNLFLEDHVQVFLKSTLHWQGKTEYHLIPYDRAVEIIKQCQEENKKIAKQYLNRKTGQLFYETLKTYDHDSLEINNLDNQYLVELCAYIFHLFKID